MNEIVNEILIPITIGTIVLLIQKFIDWFPKWLHGNPKKLSILWALTSLILSLTVYVYARFVVNPYETNQNKPNINAGLVAFSDESESYIQAGLKDYSPLYFLVFVQTKVEPAILKPVGFIEENQDSYWLVDPFNSLPIKSLGFTRTEIQNVYICVSKGKRDQPLDIAISNYVEPIDRLEQEYGRGYVKKVPFFNEELGAQKYPIK